MEGMPERRSTSELRILATLVFLKYSATNREVEKASGRHIIRARIEVINVPAINGSAPYTSCPSVGFHLFVIMNFSPNALNAGMAPPIRENIIPAATIRTKSDAEKRIVFVSLSLFIH